MPKEKIEGAARVARHSLTPTENGGIESTTSDVCSDAEFDTRRLIKCVSIPHALFISVDFAHFSPSSAKAASSASEHCDWLKCVNFKFQAKFGRHLDECQEIDWLFKSNFSISVNKLLESD